MQTKGDRYIPNNSKVICKVNCEGVSTILDKMTWEGMERLCNFLVMQTARL